MFSAAEQDRGAQALLGNWSNKGIIIPTRNAASDWSALHASLLAQGVPPDSVLVIDSSSTDGTAALARAAGYRVVQIAVKDFRHGATRQLACSYLPAADQLLFLTQDAILHSPQSALTLFSALDDPTVGVAFGRQLPRPDAKPIERHARDFNYPEASYERTFEDRHSYGMKTIFCSNSFAVYRRSALEQVGGFPPEVIFGEDMYVAAKLLMAGWKLRYQADAAVYHSHDLSMAQEFTRYFTIGMFHTREIWILETFGTASGEGSRFVRSQLAYVAKHSPLQIPEVLLRTPSKLLAYHLGRRENKIPLRLKRLLSGNPSLSS